MPRPASFSSGIRAQLFRAAVVIGPVGRDDGEAARLVTRLDRVPAARIEPGAVDEQDGVGHSARFLPDAS